MSRLDTLLLALLSGIGWACSFALVCLGAFDGGPGAGRATQVFGVYGFAAGVALAAIGWYFDRPVARSSEPATAAETTAAPAAARPGIEAPLGHAAGL